MHFAPMIVAVPGSRTGAEGAGCAIIYATAVWRLQVQLSVKVLFFANNFFEF